MSALGCACIHFLPSGTFGCLMVATINPASSLACSSADFLAACWSFEKLPKGGCYVDVLQKIQEISLDQGMFYTLSGMLKASMVIRPLSRLFSDHVERKAAGFESMHERAGIHPFAHTSQMCSPSWPRHPLDAWRGSQPKMFE